MGVIGGTLGFTLLNGISKKVAPGRADGRAYARTSKLEALFGSGFWNDIEGKVVIDFGCGTGAEAVAMAERGARKVIGIDVQESYLASARQRAAEAGVSDRCRFATTAPEPADVIVSVDAFEHFDDPAGVLRAMHRMLKPRGRVIASFGPCWYHPLGGHLFSLFPWAHLIFTESALIRWRSQFKDDGATRFREVAGGLNQMTIKRFERLVAATPFEIVSFETIPIRKLAWLANRVTREFTTSIVRCKLEAR